MTMRRDLPSRPPPSHPSSQDMTTPRYYHAVTRLKEGRSLVSGRLIKTLPCSALGAAVSPIGSGEVRLKQNTLGAAACSLGRSGWLDHSTNERTTAPPAVALGRKRVRDGLCGWGDPTQSMNHTAEGKQLSSFVSARSQPRWGNRLTASAIRPQRQRSKQPGVGVVWVWIGDC